ncbi:MAG: hypothetical protein S0880_03530 [Actinomycetota bacterium]|nr:hypothetical protein [Actinomycetota bacterium]
MAASELPAELPMTAAGGEARPLSEWLINFQMLAVVLDPYTYESSWILDTAGRILTNFTGSSVRTSLVMTCDEDGAKEFLGPWFDKMMVFVDPDRTFARAAELESLPAFVHVRQNLRLAGVAEGWEPAAWRTIAHEVAEERHWSRPIIPAGGDPIPYEGSPALG